MIPEQPDLTAGPPEPPRRSIPGWMWFVGLTLFSLCIVALAIGGVVYAMRSLPALDWPSASSPTPEAIPPAGWKEVLNDPFVSNQNDWDETDITYVEGRVQRKVDQYVYHWDVTNKVDELWFDYPGVDQQLGNMFVSVEVEMLSPYQSGMEYGLVFRFANEDNYYMLSISDNGYWRLDQQVTGNWIDLSPSKRSADLQPGKMNKIAVMAQGSTLSVFINDQYQGQAKDDQIPKGDVGLYVGADQGQTIIVNFDNFEVYAP